MFVDKVPRAESLDYVRHQEFPSTASVPEPRPQTKEDIDSYLVSLKPQHYAALAEIIDGLLETSDSARASRPPDGLLASPFVNSDASGFRRLEQDAAFTLMQDIAPVSSSIQFIRTAKTTQIIGELDGDRHSDLDWQLRGGITTAVTNMVALLQAAPSIVAHHAPGHTPDMKQIAYNSVGLPWRMSMMCINKMMVLQGLISHTSRQVAWSVDTQKLDPDFFELTWDDGEVSSIKFTDLTRLEAPEGYTPHSFMPPLEKATKLGDIACHQEVTIGCPVTLLPRRLHNLWYWLADVAEARELWQA